MMRVLITGSSGFLGRPTADLLRRTGWEVIESHALTDNLLDPESRARLVERAQATHLLHLAWYAVHGLFWTSPENDQWTQASTDLFKRFAQDGGKKIVVAGSCAEYSWPLRGGEPFHEESSPTEPSTRYGQAKLKSLRSLQAQAPGLGISFAWGRVFHLYGPREQPGRFVPSVIRPLLRGEKASLTSGEQVRDFLHVEDVARALVLGVESSLTGVFNIGSGEPKELREVAREIGQLVGRPDLLMLGDRKTATPEPERVLPNVSKLKAAGFNPRYTLHTGLKDALEWWKREEAPHVV